MNRMNPKKLLHSKWTAVKVVNKEKHFMVVELDFDEEDKITHCLIEAVISNRSVSIQWQELKSNHHWLQGWR